MPLKHTIIPHNWRRYCLLITALLGLLLVFRIFFAAVHKQIQWQVAIPRLAYFVILQLVALWGVYQIIGKGNTQAGRGYLIPYYSRSPLIFLRDTYDFITYHLNFVYEPNLYRPLGINLLSLPFVPLVIGGIIIFMLRNKVYPLVVISGLGFLFLIKALAIFPYGGTRHSFTLAPFIYIFAAYALSYLEKSPRIKRFISASFILLVLGMWGIWGWHLYDMRQSRLDFNQLVDFVQEYNVEHIVAFANTYSIITALDYTYGYPLTSMPISISGMGRQTDVADINLSEDFLLVSTSYAIDAQWENPIGTFPSRILSTGQGYQVTVLISDDGLLPSDLEVAQSIYWPVNGFFVYLIEPDSSK